MIDKIKLREWYNFQARFYSFWRDDYSLKVIDAIAEDIRSDKGRGKILDLGCGSGLFSIGLGMRLSGASIVGIDFVRNFIRIAREKADAEKAGKRLRASDLDFLIGDIEALPFKERSFQAAVAGGVFPNINAPEAVLMEAARILKKGSPFYIIEFSPESSRMVRAFIFLMVFMYKVFTFFFRRFRFSEDWRFEKTFVDAGRLKELLERNRFAVHYMENKSNFVIIKAVKVGD